MVKTLLKRVIAVGVTSFGGSKDGGRDACFYGVAPYPSQQTPWSGDWVFQVKYVDIDDQGAGKPARSSLKSAFKREVQSILARRDQPIDNYLLITNLPLTSANRDELRAMARAAYAGNFAVIDGNEVCEWLDNYPETRRSFPQLLGLSDLQQLLHSAIYNRSRAYFERWAPRLACFVQTDSYLRALQVLKKHNFLILDGPPETGKTMIAAAVAMVYASEGFEVYDVRSPEQVHAVIANKGKKIFIADDAIGSVSLESDKNDLWARDLPGLVTQLNKDCLLVWTARHYILEAAIAQSSLGEALDNFPGEYEVVVEVSGLRVIEKAEILYNHAKQAQLNCFCRDLLRKFAPLFVQHPNFTPERIRQIVEYLRNTSGESPSLLEDLRQFLTDPGSRWKKAFDALSHSEQLLLISLLDLDENTYSDDLKAAYEARIQSVAKPLTFHQALLRLKHSFLTVGETFQGVKTVNFKHPSLRDLLLSELREDPTARRRYIELTTPTGLAKLIDGVSELASEDLERTK